MIQKKNIKINPHLLNFINNEVLKELKINENNFWEGFSDIIDIYFKKNIDLLNKRKSLQNKINNGRYVDAARVFLDYWQGEGSWVALPSRVQNELSRVISKLPLEFRAIFETPYLLKDYAMLKQSILVSAGTVGTPTAQKITKVFAEGVGSKILRSLVGVGHLAPITHPSMMNSLILEHLKANPIADFRK